MKFKTAEDCKAAIKALENLGLPVDQDWYDQLEALGGDLETEISVPVKVTSTTRKSRTTSSKPSRSTFSNAFPFSPQELLSDEENDFLNKINTFMGYSFQRVSCIGELQQKVKLVLKDEEKTKDSETFVAIGELWAQLQKIESKLAELYANEEKRRRAYYDFRQSIDWQNCTNKDREKAYKLECEIYNKKENDIKQILEARKEKIKSILSNHSNSNPDKQISLRSSYNVFGEYIRPQNSKEAPQVILYLKGIRKYYWEETQMYAIAQTYIHEMFHAYYDADPYGPDYYIKKVEEPLTELGALSFIEAFVEVTKDKTFKQHALDSVEVKKYNAAICFYGFGHYLYNANCDEFIEQWYDVRAKINETFPAVQDYEEMFRVGYPDNEKECKRRLKAVLEISPAKTSKSHVTKKAATAIHIGVETFTANGHTFKMIEVPGSDFYMAETVVTRDFYHKIMEKEIELPWLMRDMVLTDNHPACFNWEECGIFVDKLNVLLSHELGDRRFILPTREEWQFAAKGGKYAQQFAYAGSDNLDEVGWYEGNSGRIIHLVMQKKPNCLGIYDLCGNIREFTSTTIKIHHPGTQNVPEGMLVFMVIPHDTIEHIVMGGDYNTVSSHCTISNGKDYSGGCYGLRLILK